MQHLSAQSLLRRSGAILFLLYCLPSCLLAQALPTATQVASEMRVGWNLGNSLDVPENETNWGNPATTRRLIDSVAAAGFNVLRIPAAWDSHADQSTLEIDATWLARVREVIDYGRNNDMYVILNSHWDGGWLEENPFYESQDAVNEKQRSYWTQIAEYFEDYDEHLLFAGTNEVRADYGAPTGEYIAVQQSYLQTFVDAVRATGGNNRARSLIVQTYNTNIQNGLDYFTLPEDSAEDRLFVEVHYYDPYGFTLNENPEEACTVWGEPWAAGDVCPWGQEDYTDDTFGRVEEEWVAEGVPVLLGEFGAIKRSALTGQALADHLASRNYYLAYVSKSAREHGIIPVYWDNGYAGNNGFALFDRSTGALLDQGAVDALTDDILSSTPYFSGPLTADYGLRVGSNPFRTATRVLINNARGLTGFRITDAAGRTVSSGKVNANTSLLTVGADYRPGVYVLQLLGERGIQSVRLLKQ